MDRTLLERTFGSRALSVRGQFSYKLEGTFTLKIDVSCLIKNKSLENFLKRRLHYQKWQISALCDRPDLIFRRNKP